jgi:hypothetical protein
MKISKSILIVCSLFVGSVASGLAQATVRLQPTELSGPRILSEQTRAAAVRDYLQSWQTMRQAFEQNRANLLDADFVGNAKTNLLATIQQQAALGIHTSYQDRNHNIQIVFYSPEGLSIELIDNVEYDVVLSVGDKGKTAQHVSARYVIVLTPAEVRWRVRVFQASPK